MSRSFDSHHVHTRSIKVDPQSANDLLRSHNLLVKIIWSGFGEKNHASEQHPNTAPSCGQWDVFDWKYLVDQLNNPAHNRPVYGLSDNGHHHNYTVMGDQRDRRRYFDPTTQQIVYRAIHSARGRSKPGIETIKAGSYTLLPPHGQMTYCRGLNPTTGRTARSGTAHYNSTTRSFPGFQIGWLFSADSADGGVFKHCCETDMFARRLPWLGNNAAMPNAMRNSPHQGVRPDLITADALRAKQNTPGASRLSHNDMRFKATKQSVRGLVIPDDINGPMGDLAVLNAVHKKLYLLQHMGIDCPIYTKQATDAELHIVTAERYWQALARASVQHRALVSQLATHLLPMSPSIYAAIQTEYAKNTSQRQAHQQAKQLILQHCTNASQTARTYSLGDSNLLKNTISHSTAAHTMNNVCIMTQAGANIEDPEVLQHLVTHWQQYRDVLSAEHQSRIILRFAQNNLAHAIVHGDQPHLAPIMRDCERAHPEISHMLQALRQGHMVQARQLLHRHLTAGDGIQLTVSANDRQMLAIKHLIALLGENKTADAYALLQQHAQTMSADRQALCLDALNYLSSLRNQQHVMQRFTRSLHALINEHLGADNSFLKTTVFDQRIFTHYPDELQDRLLDQHLEVKKYKSSSIAQRLILLNYTLQKGHDRQALQILLDPKIHPQQIAEQLVTLVSSQQFESLAADQKAALLEKTHTILSEQFTQLNPGQQQRLIGHIYQYDRAFFNALCADATNQPLAIAEHLRRLIQPQDMACFAGLLQQHHDQLNDKHRVWHAKKRRALPTLQGLIEAITNLNITRDNGQHFVTSIELQPIKQALHELSSNALMTDGLRGTLRSINATLNRCELSNARIDLSTIASAAVAVIPQHAFDSATVNRQQHAQWRQHAYEYFRREHADGCDSQSSVKVYTTRELNETSTLAALDRETGYAMPRSQRPRTKQRVICSNAQLYQDDDHVYPISMVSVVAPNLRQGDQYGDTSDSSVFIQHAQLHRANYYQAMHTAWALSLNALSGQAYEDDKQSIIITPLLGGGAYLQGQPLSVKQAAVTENLRALIDAYNAHDYGHLTEIHLCIPVNSRDHDFDAFAYLQSIQEQLPRMHGRLIISQSDLFELSQKTQAAIDPEVHKIALVNPSSDCVPGGGCYADQAPSHFGARKDIRHQCSENTPGRINLRPMALEEQLAHVTDFMYSQCASMNPRHFTTDKVKPVSIDRHYGVVTRANNWQPSLRNRPVSEVLKENFTPAYAALAQRPAPPRRAQQPHLFHATQQAAAKQARLPQQRNHYATCMRFINAISNHASPFFCSVNKFDRIRESLIRKRNGVPQDKLESVLKDIIREALRTRGTGKRTNSGEQAVLQLNDLFRPLANIIKDSLKLGRQHALNYEHLQQFQQPVAAVADADTTPRMAAGAM